MSRARSSWSPRPRAIPSRPWSPRSRREGCTTAFRARTREARSREVVQLLRLPDEVDRAFLLRVLLAREAIAPTAIGDGIAIPHVRNPVVLHVGRPSITLCFLEQAIDYGALDGKPVHTLFTIISPTTRAHLHLMSRLAFVLRDADVRCAIERQESRPQLLREIARAEEQLAPSYTPCPPPVEVGSSHSGPN